MKPVRLACQAMATRFELLLYGEDTVRLRAAGEEAVREIRRLHDELSAFRSPSRVSRINAQASTGPVRLSAELFQLLIRAQRLSEITDGAFDLTVGPLLTLWGFRGDPGPPPDKPGILQTLNCVGFRHLLLDSRNRTVTFEREGMRIDLGGIGKGYALDVASDILIGSGVASALLHGGTSSVRTIGRDPSGRPWGVAIERPFSNEGDPLLGTVSLVDEAMSVSAVSGRFLETDEGRIAHVIDPRYGEPVRAAELALAVTPTATEADALSTGLLVLGHPGLTKVKRQVVGFRGAVFSGGVLHQEGNAIAPD